MKMLARKGSKFRKRKGCLPFSALGKRVVLQFHDHCIYSADAAICEVQGIIEAIDEARVTLRWWTTFDKGTEVASLEDVNNEICRILQGTIIRWAVIEPKKWEKC
jgi:hypothetical protein